MTFKTQKKQPTIQKIDAEILYKQKMWLRLFPHHKEKTVQETLIHLQNEIDRLQNMANKLRFNQ